MTDSEQSARLRLYLKDAVAAILETVVVHGWWELYTEDEIKETVLEEYYELRDAWSRFDYHSPHGVIAELQDCIIVSYKAMLRLRDMAEKGEI